MRKAYTLHMIQLHISSVTYGGGGQHSVLHNSVLNPPGHVQVVVPACWAAFIQQRMENPLALATATTRLAPICNCGLVLEC